MPRTNGNCQETEDGGCLLTHGCHVHFYAILPGNKRRTHVAGLWGEEDDILKELDYMMANGFQEIKLEFSHERALRFIKRPLGKKWQTLMWAKDVDLMVKHQENLIIAFLNDKPESTTAAILEATGEFTEADFLPRRLDSMSKQGLIICSRDGDHWSSLRQQVTVESSAFG